MCCTSPQDVFRACERGIPDASTLERMCEAGGVLSLERYKDFLFAERPRGPADRAPFLPDVLVRVVCRCSMKACARVCVCAP